AVAGLLQAEADLAAADARLDDTRLVARAPGVVLSRSVEVGEVAQPARPLLVIAADAPTELAFSADEANLGLLRIGQRAKASPDAYPDVVCDGEVDYVAPSIDAARGSVEVRLAVHDPPAVLKPDMTVSVDVTVASKPRALTVPSAAVQGMSTRAPWVWVIERGRLARRDVALGLRGEGSVEIASGLRDGEIVALAEGRRLAPGERVRARREGR
ncbi:MAG TPA: efflux RND transporter periplasmic adaptor subunit, partial [Minicystis sp.]|nr:efflux RND transporter periplasmic adaptor subunit [Minicystis sp.]